MIRLGRRFNEAGLEELTVGLGREEGGRLLENLEADLTKVEEGWEVAADDGIDSSSSSLGDTTRSSASRLLKFSEFSLLARLSLITGTFSLSNAGLDLELPVAPLDSLVADPDLWSLVDGLPLLVSLESLRSLRAGLGSLGLTGLSRVAFVSSSSCKLCSQISRQ